MTYRIAALYKFVPLINPKALRDELIAAFTPEELCGTLLIAAEGVNGTLAGSDETIERLLTLLGTRTGLERSDVKFAEAEEKPFGRLKFRVKQEIIAFRKAVVDPTKAGTYVQPSEWNKLIDDPDVLMVDTRNQYETEFGMFAGATDPAIATFSDFVTWAREHLDPQKTPKVAMYCTGGIRCEKASAFLLQEGFAEVFHLKGGILKYLEEVPEEESRWQGSCFVFDDRTAVSHDDLQAKETALFGEEQRRE
jgi:UPF0176 protein